MTNFTFKNFHQVIAKRIIYAILSLTLIISFSSYELHAQYAVDAAMVSPHNGKIYMFRGDDYIRVEASTLIMDAGYPLNIITGWGSSFPAGWEGDWDAMAPIGDGTNWIYIFKDGNYIRFETSTLAVEGPFSVAGNWTGIPPTFGEIKAALPSGPGQIWVYDEDEYFLYDHPGRSLGQTGTLASLHGDYFPADFASLDAAIELAPGGDRIYIRGTQATEWASLGNLSTFNIDASISNWGWTDAVLPFANGSTDLDMQITDDLCTDLQKFPIVVPDPGFGSNQLGNTCRLSSVAIHLTHTFTGDLNINLISPSGTSVNLVSGVGGSGDDFGTGSGSPTLFSYNSSNPIGSGTAPFVGVFSPEGNFDDYFDGSSAEGTWYIEVCDQANADYGIFEYVDLSFISYTPVALSDDLNAEMRVYPNPNQGQFQLELPQGVEGNVRVIDINGKVVHEELVSQTVQSLNLGLLNKGVYFISFASNDGTAQFSNKLIITD